MVKKGKYILNGAWYFIYKQIMLEGSNYTVI